MKLSSRVAGVAAIAILAFGSAASAQSVVYNNLFVPSAATDQVGLDGPSVNSFSTGAGPVNLSQVTLALNGNPVSAGSIDVELLSNSSNTPGSVVADLGSLSDTALSGAVNDFNFSPASTVTLAANTRYWIEVTGTNSSAAWSYGINNGGIGTVGEFWAYHPAGGSLTVTPNSDASTPFQMEVQVSGVPEPGTYALFATLCLTGIGVLRRRRSR